MLEDDEGEHDVTDVGMPNGVDHGHTVGSLEGRRRRRAVEVLHTYFMPTKTRGLVPPKTDTSFSCGNNDRPVGGTQIALWLPPPLAPSLFSLPQCGGNKAYL